MESRLLPLWASDQAKETYMTRQPRAVGFELNVHFSRASHAPEAYWSTVFCQDLPNVAVSGGADSALARHVIPSRQPAAYRCSPLCPLGFGVRL